MAQTIVLRPMKGDKQGDINGSCIQKGREKCCEVYAQAHKIETAIDAQSGLATAKRVHGSFMVEKAIDAASPLFMNAVCTNESIASMVFEYYQPDQKAATEKLFYKVTLTNARIAERETYMLSNRDKNLQGIPHMERLKIVYQAIQEDHTDPATTGQDDWLAPATS